VTLEAVALAALAAVIDNDNKTNRVTSKTLMRFTMVLLLVAMRDWNLADTATL